MDWYRSPLFWWGFNLAVAVKGMQHMDYESAKAFLLNFWTRYLSSWLLQALAGFLLAHGVAAEQSNSQASAILEGLLALAVFLADFWHSRASHAAALNAPPPAAVVHAITTDLAAGTPTTTATITEPSK